MKGIIPNPFTRVSFHINLPVVGSGTSSGGLDAAAAAVAAVVLGFVPTAVSVFVGSDGSLSFLAGFDGSTGTHSLSLAR